MNKLNIICIVLFSCWAFSVKAQDLKKQADKLFDDNDYSNAASLYLASLQQEYNYDANYKLAESYRLMNEPAKAEYWYEVLVQQPLKDPKLLYNYAYLLKLNGKYKSAKEWFLKYAPYNYNAFYLAGTCDWAMSNKDKNSGYVVDTLNLNSRGSDITPAFFNKGILFASTGEPEKTAANRLSEMPDYDLVYAEVRGGKFSAPALLAGDINSKMHESSPFFDASSQTLYFTRNNFSKNEYDELHLRDLNFELFASGYLNQNFSSALEYEIDNSNYPIGQAAMSPDGTILIFVSDKPGGFGGADLYFTQRTSDQWSMPQNLGNIINTSGDEMYPYISNDGKLYFASTWHPGFGGLDIFLSERKNNHWTKPQNMGVPVNSFRDDFGFIIQNRTGYFSSNLFFLNAAVHLL